MLLFSTNLRAIRETAGITRQDLANKIGISVSALGQYEQGRREPDLQKLAAIAAALHVSVDMLLGYYADDFQKAAYLFHESTQGTATLEGDAVKLTPPACSPYHWPHSISKADFIAAIQGAASGFDKDIRPRLLRDSILYRILQAADTARHPDD